jgi:hypothetical protein
MNDTPIGSDSESDADAGANATDATATNSTVPESEAPLDPPASHEPGDSPLEPITPVESAAPVAAATPPVPLAPVGAATFAPADTTVPVAGASAVAGPPAVTGTPAAAGDAPAEGAAPTVTPTASRTAGIVGGATALWNRVGVERALGAALSGAIIYGVAWVLGVLLVALGLIAARDSAPDWSLLFEAPGQLVALAVGGIFTMGIEAMGMTINVSVFWLPLFVTAVLVAAALFLSHRDERAYPSASRGARWLRSVITGVALSVLVLVVAAILPLRYKLGGAGDDPFTSMLSGGGTGSAVSFTAFLGAVILGTAASYYGRARAATSRRETALTPFRQALGTVWRTIGLYVGAVSVLLALGLIIYFATQSANTLLSIFLWLPTLVLMGVGFVNLAPIGLFGGGEALAGLGNSQTSYWLPTELPIWATAIILVLNLALIAAAGAILAMSRPNSRLSTPVRWVTTVASFAAAGAVISLLSAIAFKSSLDMGSAGDALDGLFSGAGSDALENAVSVQGTVGLAAWTFIIFAILGGLVEASATYLAPLLIPVLPASLRARLARTTVVGAPVAAAGVVGTPGVGSDGTSPEWASVASTDGTAVANPEPMSPERKKKVIIVLASIGAAIVLVVGASVAFSVVNSTVYNPEHQVEGYLDSLIDGNVSAALDAGELETGDDERVLLTVEVLKATDGGITGYTITDTFVSGDTATVTAMVEQDGDSAEITYDVIRSGKTSVIFDNWELGTVYAGSMEISVPEGTTEIVVNDVNVSIADLEPEYGYLTLAAFPGEYTVAIGGSSEYLSSEPVTVVVPAELQALTETLSFTLEPTDAFHAEVSTQIEAYLASCAAQGVLEPEDCPIYTYAYGDITDVVWTITEPATFTIEDYGNGEWYVSNDDYGVATVSYTRSSSFSPAEPVTDDRDFSVRGMVKMVDGAPVYSYDY